MKVAVTGHRGLLGLNMVKFLQEKGHEVMYSDSDFRDYEMVELLLRGCDWVFHFAANTGGIEYIQQNSYDATIDSIEMDLNVLKACKQLGIKQLFYPASACMYPDVKKLYYFSEDEMYLGKPSILYGETKRFMAKLADVSQLDVRVGILHTVYGPQKIKDKTRMKFPQAIASKALESKQTQKPIEIWGDGTQVRTFLYVSDATEMIWELMNKPYHGPVNISAKSTSTVLECAEVCCDILQISDNFTFNLQKPAGMAFRGSNNTKWEQHYEYRPQVSLRQGFASIIDSLKTMGIYIPTYGRHQVIADLVTNIHENTTMPHRIMFGVEPDDIKTQEAIISAGEEFVISGIPGTHTAAANTIYQVTTDPYFIIANDDFRFHLGWDSLAVAAMDEKLKVVGVNDLGTASCSTIFVVDRSYIETQSGVIDTPNTVFYPGYKHNYVDTEFYETAEARGVFTRCPDSHVEHMHPGFNKGKLDATYEKANLTADEDKQTFILRRSLWIKR